MSERISAKLDDNSLRCHCGAPGRYYWAKGGVTFLCEGHYRQAERAFFDWVGDGMPTVAEEEHTKERSTAKDDEP